MAISVKDTNKRDLKIKDAQIVNGKFYVDGEIKDLNVILNKFFKDEAYFDLSCSIKTENDVLNDTE